MSSLYRRPARNGVRKRYKCDSLRLCLRHKSQVPRSHHRLRRHVAHVLPISGSLQCDDGSHRLHCCCWMVGCLYCFKFGLFIFKGHLNSNVTGARSTLAPIRGAFGDLPYGLQRVQSVMLCSEIGNMVAVQSVPTGQSLLICAERWRKITHSTDENFRRQTVPHWHFIRCEICHVVFTITRQHVSFAFDTTNLAV